MTDETRAWLVRAGGWTAKGTSLLGKAIEDLLYPRVCLSCGSGLPPAAEYLCAKCAVDIQYIGEDRCPKCGYPFGPFSNRSREACPECRDGLFFTRAVAVWRYKDAGREVILHWKYRGMHAAEPFLTRRMVELLSVQDFLAKLELVVAVPMHWRRRMVRRFNPSDLLAREVAKGLGLQYGKGVLARTRNTPSQTTLAAQDRLKNVEGAFRVRKGREVAGKRVLLVDDVITTCATVAECSKALKEAGAKAVYVAGIGR